MKKPKKVKANKKVKVVKNGKVIFDKKLLKGIIIETQQEIITT